MLEQILPSEIEQMETAVGFIFQFHVSRMSAVLCLVIYFTMLSVSGAIRKMSIGGMVGE
jgi:hypothetical protein